MFAAIHCKMRMKHTNACSYALTWVDVGFNMKISVAVSLKARIGGLHFLKSSRVSLRKTSRLCLHQSIACNDNETHERTFLYALTWVNVGFNMKVSVAVFLTGAIIALDETLEHIHESNAS